MTLDDYLRIAYPKEAVEAWLSGRYLYDGDDKYAVASDGSTWSDEFPPRRVGTVGKMPKTFLERLEELP